jgi:hypothetical protein
MEGTDYYGPPVTEALLGQKPRPNRVQKHMVVGTVSTTTKLAAKGQFSVMVDKGDL